VLRYWLIMPAAGSGSRFGSQTPKQFLPLAGAAVIEHALAPFLADPGCNGIIVALDETSGGCFAGLRIATDARVRQVAGGARRCDSVRNALAVITGEDSQWVLVHDAARPCITREDIARLLKEVADDPVGGLLATPLADTIKRADVAQRVVDTPPRAGLWRALTPQMFRLGMLRTALAAAAAGGREPTDEAQAIEWLGFAPRLVAGDPGNIKLTTPADLKLAASWLAQENRA
jgi:2-C-methyl-D-erythritol 4-phosphate cytidylyltransferase